MIDAGAVLPNLTGPYLGKAPDVGAHELGLGTAWCGPRTWDPQGGFRYTYGIPEGWRKVAAERSKAGDVLLERESPGAFALLEAEPLEGEARWKKLRETVASKTGALTPALAFRDGFLVRLYREGGHARLKACRVDPGRVLLVTAGCRYEDLQRVRTDLFCLIRSLYQ